MTDTPTDDLIPAAGSLARMPLPDLYQLVRRLRDEACDRSALLALEEAARRMPDHPGVLVDLIKVRAKLGDSGTVEPTVARAWALLDQDPAALDRLGEELQTLGEYPLALRTFARLAKFPAKEAQAVGLAREAAIHQRLNRPGEAAEACQRAERLCPGIPEVMSVKALLLQPAEPAAAAAILERLAVPKPGIPLPFTVACAHRLAAAYDKLGRADDAMAALASGKNLECRHDPAIAGFRAQRQPWRRWHSELAAIAGGIAAPPAGPEPADAPATAFLLGHPRSGTTLLEQILDANPAIRSIEESNHFSERISKPLIRQHLGMPDRPAFPAFVESLPESRRRHLGGRYLAELERATGNPPRNTTLLDKNPGLTIVAALIMRMLPTARLIVALRDPRDVCLSAYFQATPRNQWSANWLTLQETVDAYVFSMDLWLRTRARLTSPWLEVRYEDVIGDPAATGQTATRFLGRPWAAAQADPVAHARGKHIQSPTHAEVTQPLHRRAIGRWRAYERYFAPFQQQLAPFCEAFGY